MTDQRRLQAQRIREDAAAMAANREHLAHRANGDEQRYASANYPMNFSKGLDHDPTTGLVKENRDLKAFRTAIDNGWVDPFTSRVPVPRAQPRRQWEAPTAGLVYDLQGPDAQAVTMPPAPELCSDELTFEMAEVYELALLRDQPFSAFDRSGGSPLLNDSIGRLNGLKYAVDGFQGRPRKHVGGSLDRQTAFRGSSPGVESGPYLSQFMLIGNGRAEQGRISYGAQQIDQRVQAIAEVDDKGNPLPPDDYMMNWPDWMAVQQGYEVRAKGACGSTGPGQRWDGQKRRFIYTPRDLASYVHVDALYQAYLNACLILLSNKTPTDPAFHALAGGDEHMLSDASTGAVADLNAGGFALWGGPHILSLLTEVATRGLKAVRYQKFNTHLRARPEVLAARIHKADEIEARNPQLCGCFTGMRDQLGKVLEKVREHNGSHLNGEPNSSLLPMAFEEGSPMHPAYGAGHATVAGACVTILKAFFDTSAVFVRIIAKGAKESDASAGFHSPGQIAAALNSGCKVEAGAYKSMANGSSLQFYRCGEYFEEEGAVLYKADAKSSLAGCCPLTLEGELNKLAANISIGRNMAGVHYFSDYYDSLRMGEQVAVGMLEEQALCYPADPCVMSLPTFDGEVLRIGRP